ncbi:MAG: transporter substrate-binding domain-containing protein [Dorea sp.]|nr:transporter substrate-binding domain-containing protein [Dorea sp.]
MKKRRRRIMKRRLIAALLVTAMAMTMAAGCGNSDSGDSGKDKAKTETENDAEENSDADSDTGYSDRKVTLVTSGSGEPYTLLADDGTWTGIDAEMWAEIEERTGWEVDVKQAAFDAMWGELDTARADVVANCTAVKPEREEKYHATIPYYGDAQCVIVNDSSSYKTVEDLKGKVVGCTNGQAAQTIIEDLGAEIGFEVKLYEDSAVGMNDLMLERIDAYANTTTNVNAFTHNNGEADFRFFEENLLANNVAYFLPKTDEGEELKEELNKVIQEMLDDGTIAGITEKWMFADMTQLIQK